MVFMSEQEYNRRLRAVKMANAINKIEGGPISKDARDMSAKWVRGEITGEAMIATLLEKHKRTAVEVRP